MNPSKKNFLISILRFHGDVLLIEPMLHVIKREFPNSEIDLLVYKGTASLLLADHRINKIIESEPSEGKSILNKIKNEYRLYKELRSKKYSFSIFLTTQWRQALISLLIFSEISAAVDDKKRQNYLWKKSFSFIFPEAGARHVIERNLDTLNLLGFRVLEEDKKLSLVIPDKVNQSVQKIFNNKEINSRYCVVHPCSGKDYKLWSEKKFSKVIDHLTSKNILVILTCGPDEREVNYLREIERLSPELINLGGKTSLLELASLIKGAEILIGLDSVAGHISAAVNTPSVVLFGPTNHQNWRPWSDTSTIISRDNNEEYCNLHGMNSGKSGKCLCYISEERVIESADKILDKVKG